MYVYKMNASPKLCFFWTVCKTIVLTGTLKLKIPQNLQTWKVLTQILHLVIYPIHYTCTCRGKVLHVCTNFLTELLQNIQVCMYQNFRHIHCLYSFFNPAIQIHTRKIRHARSLKTLQIKTGSVQMWCTSLASLRVETSCHRGEAVKDRIRNLCEFRSNEIETEKQFLSHCLFSNKQ